MTIEQFINSNIQVREVLNKQIGYRNKENTYTLLDKTL
jgi:hypothetical protein